MHKYLYNVGEVHSC